MPAPRPPKPFHAITLTASIGAGVLKGEPGDQIEITEENREAAVELYMQRGCKLILTPQTAKPAQPSGDADDAADLDEADSENGDGLSELEATDSVDELPVPPRYIAALKEAGIKTLAEAKAHPDLSSVPGISQSIAKKIAQL